MKNTDAALEALENAVTQRSHFTRWLKVDPAYAEVRDHPRFKAIIASLKLPE